MSDFNLPDDKNPFYSNDLANQMEQIVRECSTHFITQKGDWVKEFISVLLAKNDVKMVEQSTPDCRGFETRIVVGDKIITSFRLEGFDTIKVWRDPEFYGISKENQSD